MKLKPVKNYRELFRKCCTNCRHWNMDEDGEGYECARPGGPSGDWNANEPEFHVCDRHVYPSPTVALPEHLKNG